jgi:hypothetical protein
MTGIFWLVLFAIALAFGWLIRHNLSKWQARQRAEEERFASFMSSTAGAPAPTAPGAPAVPAAASAAPAGIGLSQQRLLFDAAHKAGEAGEPALAIQLYARLLARYPETAFAQPARDAVEALRKKLPKDR